MASLNPALYSPALSVLAWGGAVGLDYDMTSEAGAVALGLVNCRRLIVITPGILVVRGLDNVDVTIPALPAAYVLDGQFKQLTAAGSTAFDILVQW